MDVGLQRAGQLLQHCLLANTGRAPAQQGGRYGQQPCALVQGSGHVLDQLRRGQVVAITDQKRLVAGGGVGHAALDEADQVGNGHQAAPVAHAAQRQGQAPAHYARQPGKVAGGIRAIHQRGANQYHLQARARCQRQQAALGLQLGLGVGAVRRGCVVFLVGMLLARAVDANGAQKHQAFDARRRCLLGQP